MIEINAQQLLRELPAQVSDVIQPWLDSRPNHLALVDVDGRWNYRELANAIAEARAWLERQGLRPGDRLMLVCENCRAFVVLFFAATDLGAWPVLANARLSAREVDSVRDHCGARFLIYTTAVSPHAQEHAGRHSAQVIRAGALGEIALGMINEDAAPEPIEDKYHDRVAALIYTSGTTGQPKGVMLSHRNLLYIAAVSAKIRSLTPEDRLYGVLPMSHAVGLSVVLLGSLLSGSTLYLAPRFDPMTARKVLEEECITILLGVPSMFGQFLQYAKLRKLQSLRFLALRIISSSGAPLDLPTKQATETLFGLPLHNGYGITECSPTIAQTRVETPLSTTSIGPLLPGVEAKLLGPDNREVPAGEIGELHVRGPNIMKGYYRAPEATADAIDADGWFNSRDLARLENGNLFIVGRTKDLIVRSGFNVYPVEVEAVLNAHTAVARSAVIGRPVQGDEEVLAFVQLIPGSLITAAELMEYAAARLATYKRPSRIILLESLPLTPTGKVAKTELTKLIPHNQSAAMVLQ